MYVQEDSGDSGSFVAILLYCQGVKGYGFRSF